MRVTIQSPACIFAGVSAPTYSVRCDETVRQRSRMTGEPVAVVLGLWSDLAP
jgi:hypothetical protein